MSPAPQPPAPAIRWALSATDDQVGPACSNVPVPPTIAMGDAFREAYSQGYRHALADVRKHLSEPPAPVASSPEKENADGLPGTPGREEPTAMRLQSPSDNAEVCICAAIRMVNGEVWRGHRHDDCIATAGKAGATRAEIAGAEQGFITSHNRFVGRKEAARIQAVAGIVSPDSGWIPRPDRELFSEDLYLRDWRSPAPGEAQSACSTPPEDQPGNASSSSSVVPLASSPAHRICFVGTCGKPDVNAPDEGTWPTCSKYPPACVDHLAFVPPPQRKGVASSPAAPEVGAYDIVLGLIEVAKSEEPETAFSRLVIQRLRRVRDMLEAASSPAPPASGDRKMEEQKTDGLLGCTASGIQHGPPSTSRRPSDALATYAEWCGSIHDDGCPQDDTCDCSAKWINDGVTDAVNILKSTGR
jgi:hypothetical protein